MFFDDLVNGAPAWRARLDAAKAGHVEPFPWYPYDILGNTVHLGALLDDSRRPLLDAARGGRVADIGCADGDFGFLLESLGAQVDFVDFPPTNHNGMQGVRRLRHLLDSRADIHEIDLDSQFSLPAGRYDLIFFFGILYHLKNPFYVLERLARHSRHCLLSTRIARRMGGIEVDGLPLAYLLDPQECNDDATNFWIFSEAGLRRLADRAGFDVLACARVGDTQASEPAHPEHDERAFLLLESRHA